MPNTYSQIYIHIVFTVKGRENLIRSDFKDELYKYISGIIRNEKQKLLAINGVEDHIHLLVSISPDISLSQLVQKIKSNSSAFINNKKFLRNKFSWQTGFGAFSYSRKQRDKVIEYINKQEEHHRHKSFREEYIALLKIFEIEYDEKYLFEWVKE